MALGIICGAVNAGSNTAFNLKAGSPILTQHHGKTYSDLGSYTYAGFAKSRDVLPSETGGGVGQFNDTVARKFSFTGNPFRLTGNLTSHNVFIESNLSNNSLLSGTAQSTASSFRTNLAALFGYLGAEINATDSTQSDTAAWEVMDLRERWVLQVASYDYPSKTMRNYLVDPADGTIMQQREVLYTGDYTSSDHTEVATVSVPELFLRLSTSYSNQHQTINPRTDYDILIAELSYWDRALTEPEIITYAQQGFAEVSVPSGLVCSFNFMRNWAATSGTKLEVVSSVNPSNVFLSTKLETELHYVLDNPVPVYLLNRLSSEHDSTDFGLFSATAGTSKVSAYPSGTAEPSKADIFNGVGAVSQITIQPDGLGEVTGTMTGLDTGTEYVIYSVQDELDGGNYGPVASITFTTPTKYSENILDVAGASVGAQTGIQWAWFDSVDPDTLSSPSAQGTAEVTDVSGLLEVTLPTTISTAKGAQGTMVLKANWNAEVQSASHIVTVK